MNDYQLAYSIVAFGTIVPGVFLIIHKINRQRISREFIKQDIADMESKQLPNKELENLRHLLESLKQENQHLRIMIDTRTKHMDDLFNELKKKDDSFEGEGVSSVKPTEKTKQIKKTLGNPGEYKILGKVEEPFLRNPEPSFNVDESIFLSQIWNRYSSEEHLQIDKINRLFLQEIRSLLDNPDQEREKTKEDIDLLYSKYLKRTPKK